MSDQETTKEPPLDFAGFEDWQEVEVTIHGSGGASQVRGLIHPRAPGLAVTEARFGRFDVTHVRSGKRVVGAWERMGGAKLALAELAVCFEWDRDDPNVQDQLAKVGDDPVPYKGAVSISGGKETTMTRRDALMSITTWTGPIWSDEMCMAGDEFPWETPAEGPDHLADEILLKHGLASND